MQAALGTANIPDEGQERARAKQAFLHGCVAFSLQLKWDRVWEVPGAMLLARVAPFLVENLPTYTGYQLYIRSCLVYYTTNGAGVFGRSETLLEGPGRLRCLGLGCN